MKIRKNYNITNEEHLYLICLLIFILTFLFLKKFTNESKIIYEEFSKNKIQELSSLILNQTVISIIDSDIDINSLIIIKKNKNDEIIGLDFDTYKTNKIMASANEIIMQNIKTIENENINMQKNTEGLIFKVPLGVTHGISSLVYLSPKIPIKINIIANTFNEIKTEVKEYGINNSLVEIKLECTLNMQVILPFQVKNIKIQKLMPLSTKIIQGKIPEYYGGTFAASTKNVN